MWLEFTFGFMLLFSFLIDLLNEASHLQGRHWVCGLLCVTCGGEVVVCVLGVVWDGKVGSRGVHLPINIRYSLVIEATVVEHQLCFLTICVFSPY